MLDRETWQSRQQSRRLGQKRALFIGLLGEDPQPQRLSFMTDSVMLALGSIFKKICILVTAAFALTLVPSFRRVERSLLSVRDRGNALLVFLVLGLVEDVAVRQTGWFNHRIVAVCAAGLLAGPGVGAAVAAFMTWLAVIFFYASGALMGTQMFRQVGIVPVLQGLGTALILVIVALVRDRDEQTQAA